MMTPPNTKKRRGSTAGISVDHSRAERTAYRLSKKKKPETPSAKKFKKKVLKVLKEPSPTGVYNHLTYIYLPVSNGGLANVCDQDMGNLTDNNSNRAYLEFFSPRQFKDAEAVCFNNKNPQHAGWIYMTEEDGVNLPYNQITRVNNSSVSMHIKNFGVHHTMLQIYKLTGKGGGTTPRADVQSAYAMLSNFTVAGYEVGDEVFRNLGTSLNNLPEKFHQMWDIEVTTYEFEPGEETWHFLKGPRTYNMNGAKKIQTVDEDKKATSWKLPNEPGCGCYIMFRAITDFALVSGGTAANPAKVIYDTGVGSTVQAKGGVLAWPNLCVEGGYFGGLGVSIQRKYSMEMPEGLTPTRPSNALKIYNGVAVPTGGTIYTTFTDENIQTLGYSNV